MEEARKPGSKEERKKGMKGRKEERKQEKWKDERKGGSKEGSVQHLLKVSKGFANTRLRAC